MIRITPHLAICEDEIELSAIRAMGSGGQNVNKVSSAIHLRFDIYQSSLPEKYQRRLLNLNDSRITKEGVLIIKAQTQRTQERNKEEAIKRMVELIKSVTIEQKARKPTKPSMAAKRKRLDRKKRAGLTKSLRGKINY
jgi:ribosome-associated protein